MLTPKENLLRAIRHDQPEWVPTAAEGLAWIGPPVVERCTAAGRDAFGVHWSYEARAEGGTFPTSGGHTISDLARWKEQITIPDIDAMAWDAIATYADGIDRDHHLLCGFIELGLFERSYLLLGMSEALMGYVAEPELMYDLLGALTDYKIRLIERLDARGGARRGPKAHRRDGGWRWLHRRPESQRSVRPGVDRRDERRDRVLRAPLLRALEVRYASRHLHGPGRRTPFTPVIMAGHPEASGPRSGRRRAAGNGVSVTNRSM